MKSKEVAIIDTTKNSILTRTALQDDVIHVELMGENEKQVVTWLKPSLIDIESMKLMDADKEQYDFGRRFATEVGEYNKPGRTRYSADSNKAPHTLQVETLTEKGWEQKTIDTKSITGTQKVAESFPSPLKDVPGPDVMVTVGNYLFFTSPSTGKVGILDIKTGELKGAIDVGRYLSDIVADNSTNKLFIADALGNRIVVIDAEKLSIEGSIDVPKMPVALVMFMPQSWLKGCQPSLFVACWDAKKVVNIDTGKLKVTQAIDLPINPLNLVVVNSPNNEWWTLVRSDRIDIELRTRLAVFPSPKAFSTGTLSDLGVADVYPKFGKRTTVSFDTPKGLKKRFSVDNEHTIQIALADPKGAVLEERWIDVSQLTDGQFDPQIPLGKYDQPGSVTISLDDGPEYPWRREIWMTPDQQQFLVSSTEEFWRWNATVLHLKPERIK